ncbi:hypothetical protein H4696_002568 [Amycolatopsis lexingtonensis]|uniref:Uncharacterized protein n=1 Tax=Amycolatopsis lexingtonensis TaxID=218822 RepID=A0ABR9HX12_9PSEU|nr:hypothetical protein [Amycolatopsis lexingtonensis]
MKARVVFTGYLVLVLGGLACFIVIGVLGR